MKPKNQSGILLILALFILSLISGTVAAQTPAGEQYEKINKQYQIQKEQYNNIRKQFENAKEIFEKANRQLRDGKDNKSNETMKENAIEYILKAIDYTEAQLQIMKNRLESPENKGIIASDAIKVIDAHTAQLEQLKGKVNQTATIQELKDAHKELKNIVVNINLETRYFMGIVLNHRIDNFITRADNVSVKVDNLIAKLKANGNDTTKLEAQSAEFKNKINEAKDVQVKINVLFADHSGFASNGTVTNEKDARTFLKQANDIQSETIKKLKEAGRQLIEFVRELKKITHGKARVNEAGELEINGGVTATLTSQ